MNDLGTIEFTDGVPLTVNLDQGRTCTMTPTVQPDGNLLVSMVIQEPNSLTGESETLTAPRVITRPGQTVSISVSAAGNTLGISLTPVLKGQ